MKIKIAVFLLAIAGVFPAAADPASSSNQYRDVLADASRREFEGREIGEQFVFYSVLEGLYEDGVSNADVDRILMKAPSGGYYHFIYACPTCTSTIWALQAYRNRPDAFYGLKLGHGGTFGNGLPAKIHDQLASTDPHQRLAAINTLVQSWVARRMDALRLTKSARADLLAKLEQMRKTGMSDLKSFRHAKLGDIDSVAQMAPAYVDIDECAVCNGAVGKPMKLPGDAPSH